MPNRPRRSLSAEAPTNRTGRSTRSNPRGLLPLNDRIDRLARGQSSRLSAREVAESEKAKKKEKPTDPRLDQELRMAAANLVADTERQLELRVGVHPPAQREERDRVTAAEPRRVPPPGTVQPQLVNKPTVQPQVTDIGTSQPLYSASFLPMTAPPIPTAHPEAFRIPPVMPLRTETPPGSSRNHAAQQANPLISQVKSQEFLHECRQWVADTVQTLLRQYLDTPNTPALQGLATTIADRIWRERLDPQLPDNRFMEMAVQKIWSTRINPSLENSPLVDLLRQEVAHAVLVSAHETPPPAAANRTTRRRAWSNRIGTYSKSNRIGLYPTSGGSREG